MNGARYAYLQRICELVEEGADIVIVSEDYAAPVFDQFRMIHPERFLSVGIAEQNGVAVGSGLALAGKYPIVYGCAPFPLTRALDQVKSAAALMHLPMTILNSGIGFGVPEFGATHYNADDIALVRGIPGVRMITPTDNVMAKCLAEFSINCHQPIYIRFDKYSEGEIYNRSDVDFESGFHTVYEPDGKPDVAVVSCGSVVQNILKLSPQWKKEGVNAKIVDVYSLPCDEDALLGELRDLPIVTVEEHIDRGGLGSILLEAANERNRNIRLMRKGIRFGEGYPQESGSRDYFMRMFGLSDADIVDAIVTAGKSARC